MKEIKPKVNVDIFHVYVFMYIPWLINVLINLKTLDCWSSKIENTKKIFIKSYYLKVLPSDSYITLLIRRTESKPTQLNIYNFFLHLFNSTNFRGQ